MEFDLSTSSVCSLGFRGFLTPSIAWAMVSGLTSGHYSGVCQLPATLWRVVYEVRS